MQSQRRAQSILMIPEEMVFIVLYLDRAAAVLWDEHLVSSLHLASYPLAVLVQPTGPNGEHSCLIKLLDGGLGQENATCSFGLGFYALYEHAVEQRRKRLDGLECGGLGTELLVIKQL